MNQKLFHFMAFLGIVFSGYVIYEKGSEFYGWYVRPRLFPSAFDNRIFERQSGLHINNNTDDTVTAEFTKDGELVTEVAQAGEDMVYGHCRGLVRIFVPSKKGWYRIEYPFPYPLSKKAHWYDIWPLEVHVYLSDLIDSVSTGEVKYRISRSNGVKGIAKDIKVTFESGEGPQKMVVDK